MGGIAYGGAIYYSLENEDFRDTFVEYIYGAEKSVEYVEDLRRQGTFDRIEKNVKQFRNDTIEKGKDVINRVTQIFKQSDIIKEPEKENNKGQKIVEEKKIEPLFEDPILLKLTYTLNELIDILDNYDIKDKDDLVKRAQKELKELGTHIDFLKIEDQAKIQSHIAEQTEKYNQLKKKELNNNLKIKNNVFMNDIMNSLKVNSLVNQQNTLKN